MSWVGSLQTTFQDDPLMGLAIAAAAVALASTPIAFAVMGRQQWFKARRGRVMQRPSFATVVVATLLVMGIPAIFLALVAKSRHFDEDRYAFDPNKTWSVLEQGRGYQSVQEADKAVKEEMARLANERKNLVNTVKKLDEAMLKLRAVAGTSPLVAQTVPAVLQRLADVRQSVGVDAPQQLMDFTAPPAEIALATTTAPAVAVGVAPSPAPALAAPTAPAGGGLTPAQVAAELSGVPEPQRPLAAMLPLTDPPAGWTVGKSGEAHLETFNADNLFEKIDGRAESFLQYDVKGMAYAYFHPTGDESNEVQVYIFQLASPLKALGKYGSEKPEEAQPLAVGSEGYTTAGSTLFYAGSYYTQIVSTQDDKKFAECAQALARRIAEKQKAAERPAEGGVAQASPEALFAMLPAAPHKAGPKFVPQDVFGYSFLSDVFMADYEDGGVSWQGFLRAYPDAQAARAVFDKYLAGAKQDGAQIKKIDAEGADDMVVSANIGLVDALFLKGNTIAGANGATDAQKAEAFARAFAKSLPKTVPFLDTASGKTDKPEVDPEKN